MASAWILRRAAKDGSTRFRVMFRLGGRESANTYAGSFRTQREALRRRRWVEGELASLRVPDVSLLDGERSVETVADACDRWRASRVDVSESTRVLHRVALRRVTSIIGAVPVDDVDVAAVTKVVETLAAAGKKRETIRKSVKYLAAVLEEYGVDPNPARAKSIRLPHEEHEELDPADRRARRGRAPTARAGVPARRCSGSTGRAPASVRRHAHGRRLRRARPPRPAPRVDDEDARGALGRAPRRARRRARGDAAAARGPRPGGAAVPRRVRRRGCGPRSRERARAAGVPVFSPARPPAPADQPAAPAGALVGRDRAVRRPAEALGHGRHVHARASDGREVDYAELVAVRRNPTRR